MDSNKIIFAVSLVVVAILVLALAKSPSKVMSSPIVNSGNPIKFTDYVCVGATIGGEYQDLGCKTNLVTTVGFNDLKSLLGGQTVNLNETTIAVANSTAAQVAGDVNLQGEWANCGMTKAAGTYASFGNGQWNVTKTFTNTCAGAATVNGTGLYNDTAAGHLFAETTFTSATLNQNDQINITWGLQLS